MVHLHTLWGNQHLYGAEMLESLHDEHTATAKCPCNNEKYNNDIEKLVIFLSSQNLMIRKTIIPLHFPSGRGS